MRYRKHKKRSTRSIRLRRPESKKSGPDWWLIGTVLFLVSFGLLMVYEASAVSAFRDFNDRFHYVRDQTRWIGIGLISMVIMSFFPYRKLYNFSIPLMALTIGALFAVFIPGIGIKALGAKRWLNFGFLNLQPSELAKLSLIIYLSAWFSRPKKGKLLPFLVLLTAVFGLIIAQPDLGTAIIIMALALILYFVSGAPLWHIFILSPIGVAGIAILSIFAPYRFHRLTTFFNLSRDPLGASYHIHQILISLGSGGIFGVGLGKSLQKYEFLPEATTDSIFAIIGEELGFFGAIVLLIIFVFFLSRGFSIAKEAKSTFGRFLSLGIISWIGIQTAINLSAMVSLLPLTGIPLPFLSYGGSSLIVLLTGVGILINISRQKA